MSNLPIRTNEAKAQNVEPPAKGLFDHENIEGYIYVYVYIYI